jgi:hypothetical protein
VGVDDGGSLWTHRNDKRRRLGGFVALCLHVLW